MNLRLRLELPRRSALGRRARRTCVAQLRRPNALQRGMAKRDYWALNANGIATTTESPLSNGARLCKWARCSSVSV